MWGDEGDFGNADSGAVALCVERRGDTGLEPVVFQNFDMPRREWTGVGSERVGAKRERMRGGFVVPEEVRESEILWE